MKDKNITELKALGYDILANIQQLQNQLGGVNNLITAKIKETSDGKSNSGKIDETTGDKQDSGRPPKGKTKKTAGGN